MKYTDTLITGKYNQRVCEKIRIDATVKSLAAAENGVIYACTDKGLFRCENKKVSALCADRIFDRVFADGNGRVFASCGKELYIVTENGAEKICEFSSDIKAIVCDTTVYVLTESCLYIEQNGSFEVFQYTEQYACFLAAGDGKLCAANNRCIQRMEGKRRTWRNIFPEHSDMPDICVTAIAFDKVGYLWVGAKEGLFIYDYKSGWYSRKQISALIDESVYSVTVCADGSILAGIDAGAVLIKDGEKKYLPATRYACSPDVYATAEKDGALYTGSEGGIVVTTEKEMTLEEKSEYFFNMTEKYMVRKLGYVTGISGIKNETNEEGSVSNITDNDGLWTQIYLSALCFWYKETGDSRALEAARRSMRAMLFLMKAPEIKGFTARAVRFPDEEDWGKGLEQQEMWAEWHRSSDGTYEWLGETSSDEMTGHFYGMSVYYDLVADEAEKAEIREAVKDIVDHILDNNGYLVDFDGTPTTWACWNPDALNHDSMWMWEKGVNSLQMLGFLKVAYHMTGDEKYQNRYRELIKEHHFLINAAYHKRDDAHSCHIDDLLGMLNSVTILRLEDDPAVKNYLLMGLASHYEYEKIEINPLYGFIYSAFTGKPCDVDTVVKVLRDYPLDFVDLKMINSRRREIEFDETPLKWGESIRITKPLAWDERPFARCGYGVFNLDGGNSTSCEKGADYMMMYWLGRHFGIIK
ncbi:MAG: hypothetical protein MJ177_00095 [Clostridia bacterium]|nr:hypothetical protein [Clostridia bacterium]